LIATIVLASMAIVLLVWHCWETREWHKERRQLLDRIQARDYAEYRQLDPDKPQNKPEKEQPKPIDWV
jgi:uncharacterized membrane protein YccC